MKNIHKSKFKIDSDVSQEIAFKAMKSALSQKIFRELIQKQGQHLIINFSIDLEPAPGGGTYVSKNGLKSLEDMLAKWMDKELKKDASSVDFDQLKNARELLGEVSAAQGGWV